MAGHWRKSETLLDRFLKYVKTKDLKNDCWEWTGNVGHFGYGRMGYRMKTYLAPRLSVFLFHRKDPGKLFVCHKCDNPKCVNPNHLFLGTQKQNMEDCHAKGRTAGGERNGMAKLNEQQAREIKKLLKTGMTHKEIGLRYGVSRSNVGAIANGKRWGNIL